MERQLIPAITKQRSQTAIARRKQRRASKSFLGRFASISAATLLKA
jgi:hypothetical protein